MTTNIVSVAQQGPAGTNVFRSTSAKGDGSSDDTNAINSAAATISGQGGGQLYLPGGSYIVSSLAIPQNVGLRGEGTQKTKIITKAAEGIVLGTTELSYAPVTDLQVQSFDNTTQVGIRIRALYAAHIERVLIRGTGGYTKAGIVIGSDVAVTINSACSRISNVSMQQVSGDCIRLEGIQQASHLVESCVLQGGAWGINSAIDYTTSFGSVAVSATDIEGMTQGGITGTFYALNVVDGCHFEASATQVYPAIWIRRYPDIGGGIQHSIECINIVGNHFSNAAQVSSLLSANYVVYLSPFGAVHGGQIRGNYIATNASFGVAAIYMNSCSGIQIDGNSVTGVGAKLIQLNSSSNKGITVGTNVVNNTTPSGGQLARPAKALTLINGANNDLAAGVCSYLSISGPSGAFSISGFSTIEGGATSNTQDGWEIAVYNTTSQAMTIKNATGSAAANQIKTLTGADVVLAARTSAAWFRYDQGTGFWILMGQNG